MRVGQPMAQINVVNLCLGQSLDRLPSLPVSYLTGVKNTSSLYSRFIGSFAKSYLERDVCATGVHFALLGLCQ